MKATVKRLSIAAVLIAASATLAFAGMKLDRNPSVACVLDHPVLDQLVVAYSAQH